LNECSGEDKKSQKASDADDAFRRGQVCMIAHKCMNLYESTGEYKLDEKFVSVHIKIRARVCTHTALAKSCASCLALRSNRSITHLHTHTHTRTHTHTHMYACRHECKFF
jgi:hypothetical protein